MAEISLAGQMLCVEREIRKRRAVYRNLIADGKMSQETADYEIAAMSAVLETLRAVERDKERERSPSLFAEVEG